MNGQALSGVPFPGDEFDDGHFEWMVREIEAGRLLPPPESVIEGPAISISLGDACDVDPELLAAMCGPDGLGGEAVSAAFGQDEVADVLHPSPVLAALTAQAVSRIVAESDARPAFQPPSITDDELIGALQATRRLANLASYQETVVIAEFARRRQVEFEAAKSAGKPVGCRDGEFPGEELAMELVASGPYTSGRIDTAIELTTRLPCTLAGMADGTIDLARACAIASRTCTMTDADAAHVDAILAAAAPGLRIDQLSRKAEALEKKLAPEAVKARKELAKHLDQRVETRREESGNASLAGRELDTADVIASKAYIDAIAVKLRDSGLVDRSLARLRAQVLVDLTQGRNPLDRITGRSASTPKTATPPDAASNPDDPGRNPLGDPGVGGDPLADLADEGSAVSGYSRSGDLVPLPALINLLVPVGTLLGWGTAPAQAAGWGLLDADETQALVQAAAKHPRTRWCMTIVAPDGTAIAHGCVRGQHPWPGTSPQAQSPPQAAQLLDLLRRLNVTLEPIARDTCDHAHAEDHYVPSRKLKHLVHARAQTCTAPACNAQAIHSDLDHTTPYPDGPTDECNLNPKCRRHHRTKQAPGWKVSQPTPDTATWTTPSGRTHATRAAIYNI